MTSLWEQLQLLVPGWTDLIEIVIVAALVYWLLLLLQRTRAMQMILGVGFLAGVYFLARFLDFILIRTLLEGLFQFGAIAALVVFQPELRSALTRLGQSRMFRFFANLETNRVTDEVLEAVEQLARRKIGAIIALEREVGLDEYARSGSPVGARASKEMLVTIFTPYSPLHDGAVIISGDTIKAAGAILPLTQTPLHDKTMGTRHRAALGLAEETDAVVIVVSEETARISVAHRSRLEIGVDSTRIRKLLDDAFPERSAALKLPSATA